MRIFLTHVAPKDMAQRLGISVAATNFSFNLISGGTFDAVYSILPPFVRDADKVELNKTSIKVLFSKLRSGRFARMAAVVEQITLLFKIPRKCNLWLYNMTSLNAPLVRLLRIFKPSVRIYPIVLDFTPGDEKAERWLPLINSCNGLVSLSTSPLFTARPMACLPGVVPVEETLWPMVKHNRPEFILSGQLNDNISLLSRLLPAFAAIPEATLHITGNAPKLAMEYSERCPNIICHGALDYDDFLKVLHSTPFLLSTRNPDMPENKCNFPSKIIEGLLHNRIVVSTIDYPQLGSIGYIKITAHNLEAEIRRVINLPKDEVLGYANQGSATRKAFSVRVWQEVMQQIEKQGL